MTKTLFTDGLKKRMSSLIFLIIFIPLSDTAYSQTLNKRSTSCVALITSGFYIHYRADCITSEYSDPTEYDQILLDEYVTELRNAATFNILVGLIVIHYDMYKRKDDKEEDDEDDEDIHHTSTIELDVMESLDSALLCIKYNF